MYFNYCTSLTEAILVGIGDFLPVCTFCLQHAALSKIAYTKISSAPKFRERRQVLRVRRRFRGELLRVVIPALVAGLLMYSLKIG